MVRSAPVFFLCSQVGGRDHIVEKGNIVTLKTDKNRRESQVKAWDAAASNEVFFQPTAWAEDPFLQQIQREVHLTPEVKVLDIGCAL